VPSNVSLVGRKILLFMNDGANDYQQMQERDFQDTVRRHGFTAGVFSADNDANTQVAQIRSALGEREDRRPVALLVSPVSEVPLISVAYEAARLGIAWVLLSRWHDSIPDLRRQYPGVPVFSVTPDQTEAGRIQGQQLRRVLRPEHELVYIRGPLGTSTTPKRAAGLEQELRGCSFVKRTTFNGDWSLESGERIVRDWLRLFPRGELPEFVLAAQSDTMAMGARSALREWAGSHAKTRVEGVPIFGCNGTPSYGQRLVDAGELTATVVIPSVAGRAVKEIAGALGGTSQPPPEIMIRVRSYPDLDSLAGRPLPRSVRRG
jgi:ABC-type sugar transport system substrate-binding protein